MIMSDRGGYSIAKDKTYIANDGLGLTHKGQNPSFVVFRRLYYGAVMIFADHSLSNALPAALFV